MFLNNITILIIFIFIVIGSRLNLYSKITKTEYIKDGFFKDKKYFLTGLFFVLLLYLSYYLYWSDITTQRTVFREYLQFGLLFIFGTMINMFLFRRSTDKTITYVKYLKNQMFFTLPITLLIYSFALLLLLLFNNFFIK